MSEHAEQLFEQDFAMMGHMIKCAFEKINIQQDRRYHECFEHYLSNEAFRRAFDRIVDNMGLSAIVVPDVGILFGIGDEKSPFSASLHDLTLHWKKENQALIAISMVGVISFFFRDGWTEGLRKEASLQDIVTRTKELIREKRENGGGFENEEKVWEKIERAAQMGYTSKQKDKKGKKKPQVGSLVWAVSKALDYFADNHFLRKRPVDGEDLYMPRRRFKYFVEQHGLEDMETLLEI
jgi:hypothetical protein